MTGDWETRAKPKPIPAGDDLPDSTHDRRLPADLIRGSWTGFCTASRLSTPSG